MSCRMSTLFFGVKSLTIDSCKDDLTVELTAVVTSKRLVVLCWLSLLILWLQIQADVILVRKKKNLNLILYWKFTIFFKLTALLASLELVWLKIQKKLTQMMRNKFYLCDYFFVCFRNITTLNVKIFWKSKLLPKLPSFRLFSNLGLITQCITNH